MNIHASSPRVHAFYMIYKSFINNCNPVIQRNGGNPAKAGPTAVELKLKVVCSAAASGTIFTGMVELNCI